MRAKGAKSLRREIVPRVEVRPAQGDAMERANAEASRTANFLSFFCWKLTYLHGLLEAAAHLRRGDVNEDSFAAAV
jgi:hypothetical protein